MAGVLSERQETVVVDAINSYYDKFGSPISVHAGSISIKNVIKAEKFGGRSSAGTEPYTDVIVTTKAGKRYNISNKGTSAPSIAGGGLKGLNLIIPGFSNKFLDAALQKYLSLGYKDGDSIPDMYGKVSDNLKELIVVGNASIGGPIDYMYIGPMDVKSTGSGSTLRLNGNFHDAKNYAKTHDLYLRLRKRRMDQPFDSKSRDSSGQPLILGKSPSAGDTGRRIVIVPRPPSNAITVEF